MFTNVFFLKLSFYYSPLALNVNNIFFITNSKAQKRQLSIMKYFCQKSRKIAPFNFFNNFYFLSSPKYVSYNWPLECKKYYHSFKLFKIVCLFECVWGFVRYRRTNVTQHNLACVSSAERTF